MRLQRRVPAPGCALGHCLEASFSGAGLDAGRGCEGRLSLILGSLQRVSALGCTFTFAKEDRCRALFDGKMAEIALVLRQRRSTPQVHEAGAESCRPTLVLM